MLALYFNVERGVARSTGSVFFLEIFVKCQFASYQPAALPQPVLALAAGNGPDDDKRLLSGRDRVGQWGVRRLMGQILLAGEEAQEGSALLRDMVANGAAQHGIVSLERVEDRALRDRAFDLERHLCTGVRQVSQMWWKYDADHVGRHFTAAPLG